MDKTKLSSAIPLEKSYNLSEWEDMKQLLSDIDSGMYGCKNSDGEDVLVMREKGHGMEVMTFQDNGWLRVNYFTESGHDDGETFTGRWDK